MTTGRSSGSIYTPEILSLAVELAKYPLSEALPLRGSARSKTCGSTLEIRVSCDESGGIAAIGMKVTACAIGQASAAIFARHAVGTGLDSVLASSLALEKWLSSESDLPDWPDLSLIARARDYPARHGAILLPWKAAEQALSIA
ncbi:iron-sulfur cluster assembly scaffold protein [Erythrobacter sp. SDW2]|uniref:iron-sulfur cluster assembly scaffold protein n=1 Tax=Erythrobacter sp. SDW2 TaxID=2907154 RepID=UPI001F1B7CB2|nr:iron-sulfur cluster assembly scaffold protein [Erythrobacter sp. SDW2]UIP05782.1 iron-sulfur cluster assembly scaffold protein [Erythrobacter sp. SDW2]